MEAKIIRWGDDLVVRLSPQAVTQLGVNEGETVEVLSKRQIPASGARRTVNGVAVPTLAEMIAEMDRLGPSHRPAPLDWGPDVGAEIIRDDYDR
ncbi:MazF family transcriptional regulator [Methylobacterium sp. SD274]|jgi:antitoxin MazE|uniref:AbrB/MazE/SpoVT family DNA-binding domain-containing protein n=1 Tax=unclassified Methylobacterium TaxID=2615210 RepID=UPI001A97C881|nr:MazF family transcriptional regulator [Methylobacterium sp. SD274]MBO1020733.1 MazF family transcriptional regulator [Methylobacterium sp. SD274]